MSEMNTTMITITIKIIMVITKKSSNNYDHTYTQKMTLTKNNERTQTTQQITNKHN